MEECKIMTRAAEKLWLELIVAKRNQGSELVGFKYWRKAGNSLCKNIKSHKWLLSLML